MAMTRKMKLPGLKSVVKTQRGIKIWELRDEGASFAIAVSGQHLGQRALQRRHVHWRSRVAYSSRQVYPRPARKACYRWNPCAVSCVASAALRKVLATMQQHLSISLPRLGFTNALTQVRRGFEQRIGAIFPSTLDGSRVAARKYVSCEHPLHIYFNLGTWSMWPFLDARKHSRAGREMVACLLQW